VNTTEQVVGRRPSLFLL